MAISLFDTRTLIRAVQIMPKKLSFLKDNFFPIIERHESKYVDVDVVKGEGNRSQPAYVTRNTESLTKERDGYLTNSYQPPLLNYKIQTTAEDVLKRIAGQNVYTGSSVEERAIELARRDLMTLDSMFTVGEELQCAEAMLSGVVTIKDSGGNTLESISYGRSSSHNVGLLAAADRWTESTADIVANIRAWKKLIRDDGRVIATDLILGTDAADLFLNNTDIQNLLDNRRINAGEMNYMDVVGSDAEYLGKFLGLNVWSYTGVYHDGSSTTPFIDPKKVVVATKTDNNKRHYGAIIVKDESTGYLTNYAVDRFPRMISKVDPDVTFLNMLSAPLMATHNADAFVSAQVIA